MRKRVRTILLVMAFGLGVSGIYPVVHAAEADATEAAAAVSDGWKTISSGKKQYYEKGSAVTGLKKIGTKWYYFDAKGIMQTGTVSDGKKVYYLNDKGALQARMKGNRTWSYSKKTKLVKAAGQSATYYYANGKKMSTADAKDFVALQQAKMIADSITTSRMTRSQKMKTCFKWVMDKNYKIWRKFSNKAGWPGIYAGDHFTKGYGECHSDAAAFAYLAKVIGYSKVYVCNDSKGPGHSWAEINGKVYDPLFAQSKSYSKNYGVSYKTYARYPILHVKLSSKFDVSSITSVKKVTTSTNASTSTDQNLKKENGAWYYYVNGERVKNTWMTVNGYRYYFKADGAAATLTTKIDGSYYVFTTAGRLAQPKQLSKAVKDGKNYIVTIDGSKYLVNSKGQAVKGWSAEKTYYFDNTGKMVKGWNSSKTYYFSKTTGKKLTGFRVINHKIYAFGKTGKYNATLTKKIQKNAIDNKSDFSKLTKIIGKPIKYKWYTYSCFGDGVDGYAYYDNFKVSLFKARKTGKVIYLGV